MSTPAVFVDRDGVINVDHGYVSNQDDFEFIDGVFEACLAFKEKGYLLVMVTNQAGIARGLYTEDDFQSLTEWMDWNFVDKGVEFDGLYYCPHHPDFTGKCDCRKPKPGMLLDAQKFLDIDMQRSVMIGDKVGDLQAAHAAGVPNLYLVRTGKAITEQGAALATKVLDSIADVPAELSNV